MNTSNLPKEGGILALFKGPPKEGKSVAAHSFPNSYTFDFDMKMRTMANYYPDRNFDYDNFDNLIEVRKQVEAFKTRCDYDTIIVDTTTEAANLAMRCMLEYRNPDWKNASIKGINTANKTIRGGVPMFEFEDYNGESKFLGDLVDDLKVVRIKFPATNIIFIGHVITTEWVDKDGNKRISTKSLITWGNKIGASLPGKFEEVFHFERETSLSEDKPKFICYTEDHNGNGAGSSMKIPGKIDWTDKDFYSILMKNIRKEIF